MEKSQELEVQKKETTPVKKKSAGVPFKKKSPLKKLDKSKYEEQFERDHELVEGQFKFFEAPGGTLKFVFRKYKEDGITEYTLTDGEHYVLPRMVAEHLADNCNYPLHQYQTDETGRKYATVGKYIDRMTFLYPGHIAKPKPVQVRPSYITQY